MNQFSFALAILFASSAHSEEAFDCMTNKSKPPLAPHFVCVKNCTGQYPIVSHGNASVLNLYGVRYYGPDFGPCPAGQP